MEKWIECPTLEKLGEFIGLDFPEEMVIFAHNDGFYQRDEQGDPYLSIPDINDFLRRWYGNGKIRCTSVASGFFLEWEE